LGSVRPRDEERKNAHLEKENQSSTCDTERGSQPQPNKLKGGSVTRYHGDWAAKREEANNEKKVQGGLLLGPLLPGARGTRSR